MSVRCKATSDKSKGNNQHVDDLDIGYFAFSSVIFRARG